MKHWWLALALAGCSQPTDLLPAPDGGSCSAPIQLGDAPCAGALAAQLMRYSLCSCAALELPRALFTEGPVAAAVGSNDAIQIAGPMQVGGLLQSSGKGGIFVGHTGAVLGNLRSAGPLQTSQLLSIGGDAYVDGDVLGRVDVGGVLHVPMGAQVAPSVSAGDFVMEAVAVDPPCDCSAHFDLPQLVKDRASNNDDAVIGLDPKRFAAGDAPPMLTLPCGQFYLDSLAADEELTLDVQGRAALFIGGDVTLAGGMSVQLADGAELDVIVAGDLGVDTGPLGAFSAERVRLWLGSAAIKLGADVSVGAIVHAPNATLFSSGDLTARGALLLQSLAVSGDVSVHFDADVLDSGASCGAPAQPPPD